MKTIELKSVITQYMSKADDKVLRIVKAVFETYQKGDEVDFIISNEHKNIIDERLENHKTNPNAGRTWKEVEADMITKYGV